MCLWVGYWKVSDGMEDCNYWQLDAFTSQLEAVWSLPYGSSSSDDDDCYPVDAA